MNRPCPRCSKPCPANEFAAYGRHEDCTAIVPGHRCTASQGRVPVDNPVLGQRRRGVANQSRRPA